MPGMTRQFQPQMPQMPVPQIHAAGGPVPGPSRLPQGPDNNPSIGNRPMPMGMGGSVRMPSTTRLGPRQDYQAYGMPQGGLQGASMISPNQTFANFVPEGGVRPGREPKMNAVEAARQGQGAPPGFNPNDPRNAALAAYGQR